MSTIRLYAPKSLTNYWVAEDLQNGELWMFPVVGLSRGGWDRRSPYRGHRESLEAAPGYCFMGTGIPLMRDWKSICFDRSGCN